MQLFIIIFAAIAGFYYGSNSDGFLFSSKICLFAGLTLIMPTLFKVKFSDVKLILEHKVLMIKGLVANYILLPSIALGIGLLTGDFGIAAGLFIISVLGGGGMVMHWIKQSNASTSMGFVLLFINLIFVSLSLLMLHAFGHATDAYFEQSYDKDLGTSSFAQAVIVLLIVIPFIVSRIIILIEPLRNFIQRIQKYISLVSIGIIIFYLFGLQSSQLLVDIYDFEPELIGVSIIAVIIFYVATFIVSRLLFDLNNPYERAAFWHSITRYITLALVLSTFNTNNFGISMILPIMFAYIVQIPFAIYTQKYIVTRFNIDVKD